MPLEKMVPYLSVKASDMLQSRVSNACAMLLAVLALVPGTALQAGAETVSVETGSAAADEILVQVVARDHISIVAGMDGRIEELPFREGDLFDKGELLVGFDCAGEVARLDRASANLVLAQKKSAIQERLLEMGSTSDLEVAVARAEEEKARAEQAIEASNAAKCRIIAPFSGGVSEMFVQRFQTVKNGEHLMRIVNSEELELRFFVPSRWLQWIGPGFQFQVWIDELGKPYDAEVRSTGAWIDAVSQSIAVFARFSNPSHELLPGMSGYAIIPQQAGGGR